MLTPRRRGTIAAAAAVGLLLPTLVVTTAAQADGGDDERRDRSARLVRAVTLDGTLEHLRALQQAADVNAGNRAAGTGGHAASAGYVAGRLQAAGYDVEMLPFDFPYFQDIGGTVFQQTSPEPTTYVDGEDYAIMSYAGTGDVTAPVQGVDLVLPPGAAANTSSSGCEAEDFAGFVAGNIALMQRGTCSFETKAANAAAAGAVGAVIFNEGQAPATPADEDRRLLLLGTLGNPAGIPVLGTTFALGEQLASTEPTVQIVTNTVSEVRSTYNVVAETAGGRADNVVMVGAHLDSVAEGPGINDNGSGSAAQLEVAIQFAEKIENPRNKVRFAWWSAEESGLRGSEDYVLTRSDAQLGDIAAYLNFDMIASPNYGLFVYDGDDSDAVGAPAGPEGSGAIEDVFEKFYADKGVPTQGTDFDGRSDYGPFIAVGIPSGGLFTGAEDIKSEEQAALWGGTAGLAFDACYHQACDTSRNISNEALELNADAMAYAVGSLAHSTRAVNDRARIAALAATVAAETVEENSNLPVR